MAQSLLASRSPNMPVGNGDKSVKRLDEISLSAGPSLEEALAETFTLQKLGGNGLPLKSLSSTNLIKSSFTCNGKTPIAPRPSVQRIHW